MASSDILERVRKWLGMMLVLCVAPVAGAQTAGSSRPNFLIIVADDLGFSDLGAFGGEIKTPNLDTLAQKGLRLTQFHAAPSCSPSRSMLMSGTDNHIAGLGTMAELRQDFLKDAPGYEGWLNHRVVSLAEHLRAAGYHTLMSGKWHLGLADDQSPSARGFEQSFALLQGGHNHFGFDQSPGAFMRATYRENGAFTQYPAGRYSSDVFSDRLIEQLEAIPGHDKPFFAYLAFTAPHWPLQAPAQVVAHYRGQYADGPEALHRRRLERMKALGLVAANIEAHPMTDTPVWKTLSEQQRAIEARKMEVYAAMVERMDEAVGKVVAYLKKTQRWDNTVVIFLSDNGAEGSQLDGGVDADAAKGFGAVLKQWIEKNTDNQLANIGNGNSFVWYGPGWAQAGSAPLRLYKGFTTEGGIRVPAFIAGPGVRRGQSAAFTSIMDIFPTLSDLAGAPYPTTTPLLGHSWLPLLTAKADRVYAADEPVGWELFFRRAIRVGDWKAVYLPENAFSPAPQPGRWQLFDLRQDPGEIHDLAEREPDRLADLIARWDAYARKVGVQIPAALR